ncbi:MAG: isopenicillin N synthase family oxygenase [Leptolyngbya sp. SIO1D8]|nr:isopenicillin N synthase family oxygenase [Leptolyngbya sp. SIO1D8]
MPVDTSADIPLIDFAPFLTGDRQSQQQVAQAIFQACHKVGFLYLKNHGIPQTAIDRTFEESCTFFALPLAMKQQVAWSSASSNQGYVGTERERLDETRPGDLKEAFNIGKALTEDSRPDAKSAFNIWPSDCPEFRHTISTFFDQCTVAAESLFRAFAIALSMPADYFVTCHQNHEYTLRLLHYPPLTSPPKLGQLRAGTHSDYGTLTLLFQDDVGGLEVLNTQGNWITAPTIPGAILVNTGDLTQRWSNDVFRSTQHRVALPQGEKVHCDRYSIAFFCEPDADTSIVCLPSCHSQENPPKYLPVNARDYLLSRLQATY